MARRPAAGTQPGSAEQAAGLEALAAADPVLARLLEQVGPPAVRSPGAEIDERTRSAPSDYYAALVRAIVGQQLSTKAARTIYERLLGHFGGRAPTPEQVLAADPEAMRASAGLSRAKVTYLRSLAEHVVTGDLELERLAQLDDATVIRELCAVKGIGEWSAHMFLMFQLERPDVLAVGDLGVRRGVQLAYGLDALPTPDELREIAAAWAPHRTLACRLLWHSLDNEPG